MQKLDEIINDVKFTKTELQILSCFTDSDAGKPSTIAKIFDKPIKTIYSHLDRIKIKINCPTIEGIALFLKQSEQYNELKANFKCLYVDYYYRETAKKIAYKLKPLNIVCHLGISSKLGTDIKTDEITKVIELTGVTINKHEDLQSFINNSSNIDTHQFCLYIVDNSSNIKEFQESTKDSKHECLYLSINKPNKQESLSNKEYILHFEQDNKISFYSFLINYLIQKNKILSEDSSILGFLSGVDNIDNNIKKAKPPSKVNPSGNKTNETHSSLTLYSHKTWLIICAFFLFATVIIIFVNYNSRSPLPTSYVDNIENSLKKSEQEISNHNFADDKVGIRDNAGNSKIKTWNLPQILEHFTERTSMTKAIWDKLREGQAKRKTVVLVGLHGLGGIGKTTLAINALHDPKQRYDFRGWFSAETKNRLQTDYFKLGDKYHLFSKEMSDKQKISKIKNWLAEKNSILLVYDNAPDMDILQDYLPNKGHFIITSRNYNFPGAIEIDVMTQEEAIKLLDKLIPTIVKQKKNYAINLEKLSKELGYLPLALSQAGAYIEENKTSVSDYLALYETERDELLVKNIMPPGDKHQPVYVTWNVSLDKIKKHTNGDDALYLLDLIGYCDPEHIPKKLLAQCLYGNVNNKAIINLNESLALLRKYSFVKTFPDTISIHRLVHLWIKSRLSKEKKLAVLKTIIQAIEDIYPWENETMEEIDFVRLLLLQSETALIHAKALLKEDEYINLLSVLGDGYYILGDHDKSRLFFERILHNHEKSFGIDSIETAKTLFYLGRTYFYLVNYVKAIQLLEKSLVIQEKYYGPKHIKTTHNMHLLGISHLYLGNFTKVKQLLKKVLAIEEKHYGPEHVETSYALYSLGLAYRIYGYYVDSKHLLERALVIQEKHYGHEHVKIARTLHSLGRVYLQFDNYARAKQLLERALIIEKKHYGSGHVETAYTLHSLGWVYYNLGDDIKAKQFLEDTLAIRKKLYHSENFEIVHTLSSLATFYSLIGDDLKARELRDQLLIAIKHNDPKQIFTAFVIVNLSFSYAVSGDYNKSKEYLDDVLTILTGKLGNGHIFIAKVLANLGDIYRMLNKHQECKDLLERALMILEKFNDYDRLTLARVLGNLGLLYGDLGDNIKKKEYLEKALVIFKQYLPPEHKDIKKTISEIDKTNDHSRKSSGKDKILGYPIIFLI